MIQQVEFVLPAMRRGAHLVTDLIRNELPVLPQQGVCHLFLLHTSAGLTLNENADPSVRVDFAEVFDRLVPENQPYYTHTCEGPDDMPAHIKSSLVGVSLTIPIVRSALCLGTWQGIYLCEFRNHARGRKLVATIVS